MTLLNNLQTAAEAAQRQREEEAKETERRLKAALTAKKESTTAIPTSTSTEEPMPMDVSDVKPPIALHSDSKDLGNVPDQQVNAQSSSQDSPTHPLLRALGSPN
jgi:hypothetical protein